MSEFIPWNSQPLSEWAARHAPGRFVTLDGLSTHYTESGAGPPVILLHGFFFDTHMWSRNIDVLAKHYKVYAMDLWGFGYSTRQPLDHGYPLFAKQLRGFMDVLGITSASLIGQSMGAGTIIHFTLSNRGRVHKTVLVDAAALPNPMPLMGRISNLPGVGEWMYGLRGDFFRKLAMQNTFLHNKKLITREFLEQCMQFHKINGTTQAMLGITRKQFFDKSLEQTREFGGMDVPTLIIWGQLDRSIPLPTGEKMHHMVKGSRFEILEQAGHCPNIDQPERFNQLVIDFLADD